MRTIVILSLLSIATSGTVAFGPSLGPDIQHALESLSLASQFAATTQHFFDSSVLAATTDTTPNFLEIAATVYRQQLLADPLKTKVLTGISLAVLGDALAQSRQPEPYNVNRAASFAAFDGSYRAVQQVTYPPMMKLCSGKFSTTLLAAMGTASVSPDHIHTLASVEQTLVSQLVIIPTLYYPVFYAVTGAVQGLTVEQTIQRAKDTFVPLMKRNLLFWIPVQFLTFAFVEENLQIPILIACGLVWTIILSISAGAAKVTPVPECEALEMDSVVLQEDGAYYRIAESSARDITVIDVGQRLKVLANTRQDEHDVVTK
jgi:protein Mpv17